jgi:hypothetical protein
MKRFYGAIAAVVLMLALTVSTVLASFSVTANNPFITAGGVTGSGSVYSTRYQGYTIYTKLQRLNTSNNTWLTYDLEERSGYIGVGQRVNAPLAAYPCTTNGTWRVVVTAKMSYDGARSDPSDPVFFRC